MALSEGARLGRYDIRAPLGAGGMGEVYLAHDTTLNREVALKVLPPEVGREPTRFERFQQEAQALGKLNHPNVLSIYDVGCEGDVHYLVSELLEGETLGERLSRGAVPPKKAIDYGIQIASGLTAAHSKSIVHRDLKPTNIFVTRDGRIKLLDFGLAKAQRPASDSSSTAIRKLTEVGTVVGTPGYMSPEQIRDQTIDHRSDIFSFGCVLFEMLSGKPAFQRGSSVETMSSILNDEPDATQSESWPPGVQAIVAHCLEKNPEERVQSAQDLAFHLKVLSGASLGALSKPVTGRSLKRDLSLPRWALVGASGAVAGYAAALFLGGPPLEPPIPSFQQLTFRRGWISNARFSSDGETIVYGASWDGDPLQTFVTRASNPVSRPLDVSDADLLAVSPSGELAVSLGRRESVLGASFVGTLARLPMEGIAPREVLASAGDADWSPDGSELAVVHVAGSRYRLEYPIGRVLYESGGWVSHPRISPDGGRVAFLEHPLMGDDRGDVSVVDRAGEKRVLSEGWASVMGLAWSPDGDEIWYTASEVGPDTALRAVDLSGRKRLLAKRPGRLILQDVDRDGRVLLVSEKIRVALYHWSRRSGESRDLSWHGTSVATDISPDGRFVLFNEQGAGEGTALYAVYLRSVDGSPAVRLGDGIPTALSRDGRWALAIRLETPPELVLLPTGAGTPRSLPRGGLVEYQAAAWLPGGERILFAGKEEGGELRLYLQEVGGGAPEAISPEIHPPSYFSIPISSDGRHAAAMDPESRITLYPLDGSERRRIEALEPGDLPLRFGAADRVLYVLGQRQPPATIYAVAIETGVKEVVAELHPHDPAGAWKILIVQTTPDAEAYAYSYRQALSDLYLMTPPP